MKRYGMNFIEQEQKYHQGVFCGVCDKKIQKDEMEYVTEQTPYIHLHKPCIKGVLQGKKGNHFYYNNRKYSYVSKGIRGNKIDQITGKEIKEGTPCWWSSKYDGVNGKDSYILDITSIKFEDDCFIISEITKQAIECENIIEETHKEQPIDNGDWWQKEPKTIQQIHYERQMNEFMEQIYGIEFNEKQFEKINCLCVSLKDFFNYSEKKYLVFWKDGEINITTYDRLYMSVKRLDVKEINKNIKDIVVSIPEMIVDTYIKIENKWRRI